MHVAVRPLKPRAGEKMLSSLLAEFLQPNCLFLMPPGAQGPSSCRLVNNECCNFLSLSINSANIHCLEPGSCMAT